MPVAVELERLAASVGKDAKRAAARREVALEFFRKYIYEDGGDPWTYVQRALQSIDLRQPVIVGPPPSPPKKVFMLPSDKTLGGGFFAELAPGEIDAPIAWIINPDARFLKYCAPWVADPGITSGVQGDARYFIPAARRGNSTFARRA
jgi:hypothetical protein